MRLAKRYLPIVLAMLLLAFSATSAMALTGVNQQGEMAIESNDQLLFLLTATDNNTALNKVALAGGEPENIDMHTTIDDLVAVGEKVYYLRYDPPSYQIIATDSNGAQLEILSQFETQEVSKLSYYDDVLYCLVDGILTLVDPETGEPDELNANVKMSEYVIVNDVIYYVSTDDLHEYQATSGELVANASVGKLYSMSITGSNPELVLDKGVGDLKAYGNYVYMHNYDDSYLTADSDGSSWLQGRLYRMNTETNQLASMALGYDWDYYITPYGVVVYTNEDLSLYPLAGGTGKQLMKPAAISSVMAAGSNAYVFEYEAGKMTRVPLDGGSNKALFSGSKIASIPSPVTAEDDTTIEYQVDDEGNLITDEEGNAVPVEGQTTQEGEKSYEKTDGYIFPNSETERLTEEEVLAVDSSMLELGRVEVLARHGYEFKTKSYQEYFDGKSWYTKGGYKKGMLTSIEVDNMALIEKHANATVSKSTSSSSSSNKTSSSSSTKRIKLSKNVFSSSSTKKLTKSQVSKLSKSKLAIARNEILARHGYPFKQAKWKKYFKGTGWKARSNYSSKQLNSIEWYNIALIKKYE